MCTVGQARRVGFVPPIELPPSEPRRHQNQKHTMLYLQHPWFIQFEFKFGFKFKCWTKMTDNSIDPKVNII